MASRDLRELELDLWPPACPKCCANDTAMRYHDELDRLLCTCGRCKYNWRVPPRDRHELKPFNPAALHSAAESGGAGKEQPNDAVARIAKAVDMRGVADLAKIAANVEGLREKYNEMCLRLHKAVDYHKLGLGGEHVDVLVIEALNQSAADCAALRAERDQWRAHVITKVVDATAVGLAVVKTEHWDELKQQLSTAIAERDALQKRIDEGVVLRITRKQYGSTLERDEKDLLRLELEAFPAVRLSHSRLDALSGRVRVLLEGE